MTTPTTVNIRLQLRADTAANWTAANPTLLANEVGLETDTKKLKVGNGSTAWNSLAYFPSIVSGGTVLGNLEIGSTGTLTFEGSTADGFETTLAVTNPTADRTITLPNQSGTVVVSGNASIVDADIAANAEIAVSKLADGSARQLLQTDAAGTGVEWTSNVDIPGTLDVTSTATFDSDVTVTGNLTVNGTTTNINTQNLVVEDKNIILGDVATPSDTTANGGGITLKGATDKTINWVDATDAWTSSERFSIPLGSAASPSLTFTGDENTGIYSPGADQVAISTGGSGRLFVNAGGDVGVRSAAVGFPLEVRSRSTTDSAQVGLTALNWSTNYSSTYLQLFDTAATGSTFGISNANSGQLVFQNHANAIIGTNNATPIIFATQSSERLRVTSAGLVGVGTTSPTSILHCNYATATDTYIRTTNSAGTNGFDFGVSSGGEAWVFNRNNSNMYLGTNSAQRVTITAGGNVGIGTTAPSVPLEVIGQIRALDGTVDLRLNPLAAGFAGIIGTYSNHDLVFNTNILERARIDSSGRLLVGTSSARENFDNSTNSAGVQFEGSDGFGPRRLAVVSSVSDGASGGNLILAHQKSGAVGGNTILGDGDQIGSIVYQGSDGSQFVAAARISVEVDGTPGANDMPGRLVFSTTADGASSPTERMRITQKGALKSSTSGSYVDTSTTYHELNNNAQSEQSLVVYASNTSFNSRALEVSVNRSANSAYSFLYCYSNAFSAVDLEFHLRGDGNAFADGSWTGGGADYAEYFEWSDSNPDNEDRRGISVVLDGDKIREAQPGEDPIGVISGNPSVVGDAAWNKWSGKYLRDEFGTYIQEDYEVTDDDGNTVIQQRRKLNPAYDPDVEYVSREQRPEWDCVGLMGKLRIRKGQITGSRWIKMRDISATVEEWLVR